MENERFEKLAFYETRPPRRGMGKLLTEEEIRILLSDRKKRVEKRTLHGDCVISF